MVLLCDLDAGARINQGESAMTSTLPFAIMLVGILFALAAPFIMILSAARIEANTQSGYRGEFPKHE